MRRYSYSKLNLFLHVVERLPTGMHALESLFCLIKLGDLLEFKPSSKITISGLSIPQEENIVFKVAQRLQTYSKNKQGIDISITKNVPSEAGMGGGSGDGALALLTLNELWGLNLALEELVGIAREISWDMEFFLSGKHNLLLADKKIELSLQKIYFVIIVPKQIKCSTREIFANEILFSPRITEFDFIDVAKLGNDLQPVAINIYPELSKLAEIKSEADISYRMTGSGSAFFCGFFDEHKAQKHYQDIKFNLDEKEYLFFLSSSLSNF